MLKLPSHRASRKSRNGVGDVLIVIFLAILFVLPLSCRPEKPDLVFADASTVWWTGPTILARTQNFFEAVDLKVDTFDVTTGLASKNAVVTGNADIGLVASTPIALGYYEDEPIKILCSYVTSESLIAYIGEDPGNPEVATIAPTAIVPNTISQIYFYEYLKGHGIDPDASALRELHGRPPDIPNMIFNGSANSAVIWEPFVHQIGTKVREQRPEISVSEDREGYYRLNLYLITRPEIYEDPEKREALGRFLQAVSRASKLLHTEPGISLLEGHFDYRDERLARFLSGPQPAVRFGVDSEFGRLKDDLAQESRLLIESGILTDEVAFTASDIDDLFVSPDWVRSVVQE